MRLPTPAFASPTAVARTHELSRAARQRMLASRGEPLFLAGWRRALMIHFEVDPAALQRAVPFPLDLRHGRAYVSLVAFTMCSLRPQVGGKFSAWLFRPIATHDFLNVRTYVRQAGEPGIHFLAEWLTSRLAVMLGPLTFGLPYHYGQIAYQHAGAAGEWHGEVMDAGDRTRLAYRVEIPERTDFQPCAPGTLDEWLMERYTAFNAAGPCRRLFRVWHPPWPQIPVTVTVTDTTLLTQRWPWLRAARLLVGNYSPGFETVWMGRPHRC